MDVQVGYPFLFAASMPLVSTLLLKLAESNLTTQLPAPPDVQQHPSEFAWVVDFTQVVAVSYLPVVTLLFAVPVSVLSLVALSAETIFVVLAVLLMLNDDPIKYAQRKCLGLTPIALAGLLLNGVIGLFIIIRFS